MDENDQKDLKNSPNGMQLPPSDLPQMPNAGHDGALADISSPKGVRRTALMLTAAIIVCIAVGATFNIMARAEERKLERQKASDASQKELNKIQAQEDAWNSVVTETVPVINKSFKDDFGYSVAVNKVIRNFRAPTPKLQSDLTSGGKKQIVLVEYTISKTPSKVKGPPPTVTDLKLKSNQITTNKLTNTTVIDEMARLGYKALEVKDVKDGESISGFASYVVVKDAPVAVVYRSGESIVGIGSPSIPEKDYELSLY